MTHPINCDLECWRAPHSPFQIRYSRPVLEQIRLAVVEAYFLVPRGGVEIGGVLLGKYADRQVEVIEHEPIECEYVFGPSFSLSPRDEERLKDVLAEVRNKSDGLEPVGWYHSHTRSEIFLTEADLDIHERYFPEMWQVALVVRPSVSQPARAGFFFREIGGSIHASASYHEFTLEPLRGGATLREEEADAWDLLNNGNSVVAPPPAESNQEPVFGRNPQLPLVSPATCAQPQPKLECQVTPIADPAALPKRPAAAIPNPQPAPEPSAVSTPVRRVNSGSQVSTTTAVLWLGAMSLAAGLLYLPNRPAVSKNSTTPESARSSLPADSVKSSPSLLVHGSGTEVVLPPQATKLLANPTVSTEPESTTRTKRIQPDSTSALATPQSNALRLEGKGPVVVLGREAVAALELSQHPETLSKLIKKGSLFTVSRGTAIKLLQGNRLGNRFVVKVLIMDGSQVGQEGWAQTSQVSR